MTSKTIVFFFSPIYFPPRFICFVANTQTIAVARGVYGRGNLNLRIPSRRSDIDRTTQRLIVQIQHCMRFCSYYRARLDETPKTGRKART